MINQITWTPGTPLRELQYRVIEAAYSFYGGNKTATANSLGISVRTLDTKLEAIESQKVSDKLRWEEARTARELFLARQRGNPGAFGFDDGSRPSEFDPRLKAPIDQPPKAERVLNHDSRPQTKKRK